MMDASSSLIRVMIVDDHAMVRRGLATFLTAFSDMKLAGEADSGEAAIGLCAEVKPDVVLMDMVMPQMNGPAAIRLIRQQFPKVRIIALTSFTDGDLIREALEAGAIGYLLKDITAEQLAGAIRAAYHGRATLSPEVTQSLVETASHPHPEPGIYALTEREQTVLSLMVEGLNNNQIAAKLVVSPSTVKTHVSSILAKLGAASRTEAVTLALRQGLVT
jgi:two-component system, NarL family, response regulator LiaR